MLHHLRNDSLSFHSVLSLIRALGPRFLHHAMERVPWSRTSLAAPERLSKPSACPHHFSPSLTNVPMLTLFLPGSFRHSSDYSWLSACLSDRSEFYAVDYPILSTVAKLNAEAYHSDSLLQVRREIIYGSHLIPGSKLSISQEDSVMSLFLSQVRKRHGSSLSDDVILANTFIVGHSQGAGHAAVIAIDYSLKGLLLISGPADSYKLVPSSWTGIRSRTSRSRVRMFIHAEDRHARLCLHHSTRLGLKDVRVLTQASTLSDIISGQVVIDTRPLPPLKSHDCLAFDSKELDDFNALYLASVIEAYKAEPASSESTPNWPSSRSLQNF